MLGLTILLISSIANILLGMLVYIKNPSRPANRIFGCLVLSLVGIAVATFVSLRVSSPLPYIRLTMVFAALLLLLFRWFSLWFPEAHNLFGKARWLELAATLAVILIMFTPLTFSGVQVSPTGNVQPTFGPGIGAFFLLFIYMFVSGMLTLLRRHRLARGQERSQALYIIWATVFLFSAEFISSLIVPLVLKNSVGVALSPLYFAAFAAIITIAIVKRQLFDIRAVIARSVAYVLLLVTLVALYAAALFALSTLFFAGNQVSWQYRLVNILLAILLAFTFPYLRQFFDRLTQRIFYRSAYDSQSLYDQLNQVLVASQSMDELVMKSLSIIETKLKPEFALVGLQDGRNNYRVFGTRKVNFNENDVAKARKLTTHIHQKVIVADFLDETKPSRVELKEIMERNNLAVLVRLSHDIRVVEEGLGYLMLGFRKSGNTYSRQDVEVLDTIANELVIAIQNALHVEEIQQFNLTLQKRIDEATRRLRQTNRRLKLLDETKDDFISMASHQLRTPLTSVKGYISMVLEGDAGKINAQQRSMLEQSFASSQRMVYLIADLLNVSRLKTGKFVIQPSEVSLPDLVEQEIDQLKVSADSRNMTISFKKPKNFPKLMLDETKIRQVIMNFVDNAIYYTPSGGKIKVELAADEGSAKLRVTDNGIGVPKAEQHRLFTKFYRAPNARSVRPDGTGLGLFMANKVVLAQGGHIIFRSTEGKGSTFGFSFPLKTKNLKANNLKPATKPAEV